MKKKQEVNKRFVKEMIKWEPRYRLLAIEFAGRLKEIAISLGFTETQAHILAFQTTLGTFVLLRYENSLSSK